MMNDLSEINGFRLRRYNMPLIPLAKLETYNWQVFDANYQRRNFFATPGKWEGPLYITLGTIYVRRGSLDHGFGGPKGEVTEGL